MADSSKTSRTRRVTTEAALAEFKSAGKVADLAHRANVKAIANIAGIRVARSQREAIRVAARYGEDSPEATAAASRAKQQRGFAAAADDAAARAAVALPARDAKHPTIYGRVHDAEAPVPGATVEAVTPEGRVVASAEADREGHYALTVPAGKKEVLRLRVRSPAKGATAVDAGAAGGSAGALVYRDLVIPAKSHPEAERAPRTGVVPSVIGLTLGEAAIELAGAGFRVGEVQGDQADGRVQAQQPTADTKAPRGTAVNLRVRPAG